MYNDLFKALLSRGFFQENDTVTKYRGSTKYTVYEADGTVFISRPLPQQTEIVDHTIKYMNSISERFGIANFTAGNSLLNIELSPPGTNIEEEAKRISFAVDSIDTGISNYSEPVEKSEFTDEDIVYNNSAYKRDSRYVPVDENPYTFKDAPYITSKTGFSVKGLIGAIIAAIGGSLIIALLSAVGFYASISGVIIAVLVIKAYSLFSGMDIPLALGAVLVILSVFLGNVFSVAVDMYRYYGISVTDSIYLGFMSHFDNTTFAVGRVWKSFGLSLLFAFLGAISVFKKPRINK